MKQLRVTEKCGVKHFHSFLTEDEVSMG